MSAPAVRLEEEHDSEDLPLVPVLPADVKAELRRRLAEVDELDAKGLLIDDDDTLFTDL